MLRAAARLTGLAAVLAVFAVEGGAQGVPDYRNARLPVERRVQDLLGRMTLEEKARQMDIYASDDVTEGGKFSAEKAAAVMGDLGMGAVVMAAASPEAPNELQHYALEKTRLGVPVLVVAEGLHGYTGGGATIFPQAIALAGTWDQDLVRRIGRAIGSEARACGVHECLSPVLDLARDPRWGRTEETYGEDTHLAARLAVAMVQGMQGEGLSSDRAVIAEPKHFAAHGVPEGGRNTAPAHMGERELREAFLPVFEAAVTEGKALGIMSAYSEIDGVPCTANRWLLTDVLRGEWGFRGFVLSDAGAIGLLQWVHRTADSPKEAIRQAVQAGVDMQFYDYGHDVFQQSVVELAREDESFRAAVDRAAGDVLRVKLLLGLFDRPQVDPGLAGQVVNCEAHKELALEAARKAVCLLRNEGDLLPLRKDLRSIAVIGPSADVARLGDYTSWGAPTVTVLQGIRDKVSASTVVRHARGTGITADEADLSPVGPAYLTPPDGKGRGLRGEYFANAGLEGSPALVRTDAQVDFDWGDGAPAPGLPADRFSVRWTGTLTADAAAEGWIGATSDDGARLWVDGRLLVDDWHDHAATANSRAFRFEKGRAYEIKLEYYENGGLASVALGWNLSPFEETLRPAVEAARQSDVAVLVLGESERTCGEGLDRADLDLPGRQMELVRAVHATGTPVIAVLLNGRPLCVNWMAEHVPAIVEAWYPGQEGGRAVADVLFGDYNPTGRLPITVPRSVGQVPLFYSHKGSARRDYVGLDASPLFPFGHGLSYTRFAYSNLTVAPERIARSGAVTVSVDVENAGPRAGDEVVQLYVADVVSSVTTPVKALKGFERVHLLPGQRRTVRFALGPRELALLDAQMKWVVEPGAFEVMVGGSSQTVLATRFEVTR